MPDKRRVKKGLLKRNSPRTINHNIVLQRTSEKQYRTLRKLLAKAADTEFGKTYGFHAMLASKRCYSEFKEKVPFGDYSNMLPWWRKARAGQENVTWPGKIKHFALSSGTTDGSSKYIPVSKEMLRSIKRTSLRQIASVVRTDVPKDHIAKDWLMMGGSTQLDYNGVYYSGDLSGITTSKLPPLFQRFYKPDPEIKKATDWEEKIDRITREAKNWDVGMIAGVPAWIKLLLENIIDFYGVDNIHDIWPNFEVYIHGGVSIIPYKNGLDALMGKEIKYFETYLASEGFIAYQTRLNNEGGMKMPLRHGIFYEFAEFTPANFNENNEIKKDAHIMPIWEVKEGVEYALLLSTNAGAWRYLIGDTIKFTNLVKREIVITGRTKHFISLVGEHLSVDNMNHALERAIEHFGIECNEYAVAGIPHDGYFAHRWYVACDKEVVSETELAEYIDTQLKELNDDYRVERAHALKAIQVQFVPSKHFVGWMESKGKIGSQNKFPRVLKAEILDDWQTYLNNAMA